MKTVADIIDAFGGSTAFGRICGFTQNQAARGSDMKQRGSIPVRYWPAVVQAAREKGLEGISHETLVAMHAARHDPPPGGCVLPAGSLAAASGAAASSSRLEAAE